MNTRELLIIIHPTILFLKDGKAQMTSHRWLNSGKSKRWPDGGLMPLAHRWTNAKLELFHRWATLPPPANMTLGQPLIPTLVQQLCVDLGHS